MENTFEKWPTINWEDDSLANDLPARTENSALDKLKSKSTRRDSRLDDQLAAKSTYFDQAKVLHDETIGAIHTTNELLKELISVIKS
tara:strand:+ start:197 stop:457 length:261 start_codon:yes stop_codon:yes gene_type:complete